MVVPSNFVTGIMSFVLTAVKSSVAVIASAGVRLCSFIFRLRSFAAFSTYFLVTDGRMLAVSGAVLRVSLIIAKKAEPAPSVIRPASSTRIASAASFLFAAILARTFGSRFSDLMWHFFHRRSGCVITDMHLSSIGNSAGRSVTVRKKVGFMSGAATWSRSAQPRVICR